MGKPVFEKVSPKVGGKPGGSKGSPSGNIVFSTDTLAQSDRQSLLEQMTDHSGIPEWAGHVEDGFSLGAAARNYLCPKCDSPTRQHYANFIYATQIAPRLMFAPAGFFCTECPTVVVDEEMIQSSMEPQFKFQGVLGIDYHRKKEPDFFKSWNGKRAVYILDENQRPVGLETISQEEEKRSDQGRTNPQGNVRTHRKKRKTMARQSRKQNRKRK
jgi:hypothetical protein